MARALSIEIGQHNCEKAPTAADLNKGVHCRSWIAARSSGWRCAARLTSWTSSFLWALWPSAEPGTLRLLPSPEVLSLCLSVCVAVGLSVSVSVCLCVYRAVRPAAVA